MHITEAVAMGDKFVWGPIVAHHKLGRYDFLEHKTRVYDSNVGTDRFEGTEFSLFVDGKDIARSTKTLDAAMAYVLAYAYDGANSQAGEFFLKMIGHKASAK